MSIFFVGLVLVAFQVTCNGAPGRSFPKPERLSDIFQEEEHMEKRNDFASDCLRAHNARRALHQDTPPLVWDATLAQHAQAWANHLAATGTFEHAKGTGEGENLYAGGDGCPVAVKLWYDEIKHYDFNNPGFSYAVGHFTALVWKATTKVGAGIAARGNINYVVARYLPPGNIVGGNHFAVNVMPLKPVVPIEQNPTTDANEQATTAATEPMPTTPTEEPETTATTEPMSTTPTDEPETTATTEPMSTTPTDEPETTATTEPMTTTPTEEPETTATTEPMTTTPTEEVLIFINGEAWKGDHA